MLGTCHAVCLHSGVGMPGDFLGFLGLSNVKGTPAEHYIRESLRRSLLLAFVESQLKCVSIIENLDKNLYRIVDKVKLSL